MPACDEEEAVEATLTELRSVLPAERFVVAVGVNGSTDRTAEICRGLGVLTGETPQRGYGHGCQAAIDRLAEEGERVDAYVFVAADGANDPRDIPALLARAEAGADLVLGTRTRSWANARTMSVTHFLANRLLGLWASALSGLSYSDLGPLRLIRRAAFEALQLEEMTYGWTIEPQVAARSLGLAVAEIPVRERRRRQGRQKVSRVSWRHTARVGLAIMAAGWRTRRRRKTLEPIKMPVSAKRIPGA